MQEKILQLLKAKFEGVSDQILGRIAAKLAKTATTEEQAKTAVDGTTLQQVIESYGDSRATEAQQTAVRNYETKHGLKDGAKVTQTEPQPKVTTQPEGDDTPAWAKALIDANKALTERLDKVEGERITADRRAQLGKVIGKLPETLRKAYERTPIDKLTDEQFTMLVGEVEGEVKGIMQTTTAKGAVFAPPTNGGNVNKGELTKEQEAAIAKREGGVNKEGQPF